MELLEIQMKHFGRFAGQKMSFHPGVNVIYGENETGKSTMHAFIRGMLYGIERQRGRASRMDEYVLRRPWEGGGFDGSLRFESGGKAYYLERSFETKEKRARLFCESDGREMEINGTVPEALLEGMSENTFVNTVFIGQESARTDEGLAAAIRNFMVNAQSGSTSDIDIKAAMERLQRERKDLEKRKKQRLTERIEQSQELRMRMDYAGQELEELQKEEQQHRERLAQMERSRTDGERFGTELEKKTHGRGWMAGKIAMAAFAAAALMAALVSGEWKVRLLCCGVIILACMGVTGLTCLESRKQKKEREEMEAPDPQVLERERRKRQENEARHKLLLDLEWAQAAVKEKRRILGELEEEYSEMQAPAGEDREIEESLSAVYLAIDTMEEVTAEICEEYARKLNERVSGILGEITGGRYTNVYLDENLEIKLYTPQGILEIGQVSRGTMEQVYFALRMAAAELLDPGETVPILLDDAFAMYDDTRLEHTLRWLCSCGHQVLLFTCQKRERELLQKICGE